MDKIYLIVLFGVACTFVIIGTKKYAPEYALVASVCTGIIILSLVLTDINEYIRLFSNLISTGELTDNWMKSISKIIAISFLGQWGIQLCRDAGENSIADKMEIGIKISILIICIPYISDLFKMANELL